MPELPEVETIRRGLQKFLVGHTITAVELRLPKQFHGDPQKVIGGKIVAARRFGKGLVVDLSNGFSLAVHVKMTGQLLYDAGSAARGPAPAFPPVSARKLRAVGTPSSRVTPRMLVDLPDAYTHVIFALDKGAVLYYRDMRQFGWVKVEETRKVAKIPFFASLGKEPLKDLTLTDFKKLLQKYKTPIKILLMDQTKIAGIGNIYANDALYRAKIHPQRPSSSLSEQEAKLLFDSVEYVLQKGIAVGGASEWHYVDVLGGKGQYQNFFLVYQKKGEPCSRCGTPIEKITLGGRGTFFCPVCQRVK